MKLYWKKVLLLSAFVATPSTAFTSGHASLRDSPAIATNLQQASATTTTWNLNKSGSPFGFDLNAEVWNGRVAQVSFIWVFMQEWIQGKGMLKGIKDGDAPSMISLNLFVMLILLLGARFAAEPSKGAAAMQTVVSPRAETPIVPKKKRVPVHPEAFLRSKSLQDLFDPNLPADEKRLNYNGGRSPFGLKKNAEIWNGRVAMLSFAWVFFQELLQGDGMIQGIERLEAAPTSALLMFLAAIVGFNGFMNSLAESEDDFVERVVGKEALRANAADPNWKPQHVQPPYKPLSISPSTPLDTSVPTMEAYERQLRLYSQKPIPNDTKPKATYIPETPSMVQTIPPVIVSPKPGTSWDDSFAKSLKSMTAEEPRSKFAVNNQQQSFAVSLRLMTKPQVSTTLPKKAFEDVAAPTISYAPPATITRPSDPTTIVRPSVTSSDSIRTPVFSTESMRSTAIDSLQQAPSSYRSFDSPASTSRDYLNSLRGSGSNQNADLMSTSSAYDTSKWSAELAELWNGRIAQICIVIVFVQELLQHKGAVQGIQEGDPLNLAAAITTFVTMFFVGASFFLSIDGKEAEAINKEKLRDASPHPAGQFMFNPSVQSLIMEMEKSKTRSVPDFRVEGYRFKPDTRVAIGTDKNSPHPDGTFTFGASTSQIIHANDPPPPQPANLASSQIEFPVQGFQFGDATKTLIRATERNTAVPLPQNLSKPELQPIQTPGYIEVVSEGTTMNAAPMGNKASASSYLGALSSSESGTTETQKSFAPFSSTKARRGGSYLDSLSRP